MAAMVQKSMEKRAAHLALYAVGGLVGLIGANYVTQMASAQKYAAWIYLVGGIIGLGAAAGLGHVLDKIPVVKSSMWIGPVRLLVALAGVVLILRGASMITNTSTQVHNLSSNVV